MPELRHMTIQKNITVLILEDYGAHEYLWFSPFDNIQQLLSWWKNLPSVDIYQYTIQQILPDGDLIYLNTNQLRTYYQIYDIEYPTMMLDNDYSSYLFYKNKQYYHQGKKYLV